jgi:hypothetical protein
MPTWCADTGADGTQPENETVDTATAQPEAGITMPGSELAAMVRYA